MTDPDTYDIDETALRESLGQTYDPYHGWSEE